MNPTEFRIPLTRIAVEPILGGLLGYRAFYWDGNTLRAKAWARSHAEAFDRVVARAEVKAASRAA